MHTVSRVRRGMSAAAVSLALVATVLIPIGGVASAATATSACFTSEGPAQCNLVISAPDTVMTFQTFTVQVAITSGGEGNTILPSSDPCSPAKVTLDVSMDNGEDGWIPVASYTANASASVATFNISVTDDNSYKLDASAPTTATCRYNPDEEFFTAVFIPQTQPIAPCPDNVVCTQVWNKSSTAATLFADTGAFTAEFGPAISAMTDACGGPPLDYPPLHPDNGVLTFDSTAITPKTIVFALDSSLVKKGIGLFNVCWSSPDAFVPLGGGAPVNNGLLPACGKNATGPCVLFKKSNQKNVGFFGVLAPPGTNDPRAYAK